MHCCWICVLNSKQRCLCCEIGRKWPSEFLSSLILWYTVCILVSSRTAWAVLCGALGEGLQWGGEPGVTLRVLFAAGALRSQDGLAVLLADDHMWVWAHGYECVLVYLSASQVPWVGCVPSLCQPNSWAGRWGPTYVQIAAGRSTVLSDGLCLLFAVPEMALEVKTQSTDRKKEEAWLFAALNACLITWVVNMPLVKSPFGNCTWLAQCLVCGLGLSMSAEEGFFPSMYWQHEESYEGFALCLPSFLVTYCSPGP